MPDYDARPQDNPFSPAHAAVPTRRGRGLPGWALALIIVGGLGVLVIVLLIAGLVWLGAVGPETRVYPGNQTPERFIESMEDLGLVGPHEKVRYFYSDALIDVEASLYALTDQHLILRNTSWAVSEAVIQFDQIKSIDAVWSDHWLEDSMVTVELTDGEVWQFPLSMENGTDRRFVEDLSKSAKLPSPP